MFEQSTPISTNELKQSIKNYKDSPDYNQIISKCLKYLLDQTIKYVAEIFNVSIIGKIIPCWKESRITMIEKKGDKSDLKNYRPISCTAIFSKLFEKVIAQRLVHHLNRNQILINQQSGFRAHRNTKDNLVFLIQKSLERLSLGEKVGCIFFDIQSAFDKVWHDGLLYKLAKTKIPLYLFYWMQSFLSNRKFKIKINNFISKYYNIGCGVPQGAVLSPILFSIYINDIPLELVKNKQYSQLFADDLCHFQIFKEINQKSSDSFNSYLTKLENWLTDWRLKMAPEKCNYIIFSKNLKTGKNEKLNLQFFKKPIEQLEHNNPTFLGIIFDKHLNFRNQIEKIKEKLTSRINILKTLSNKYWKISEETLLKIYNCLIRSVIDYSLFLYPIMTAKNKEALQTIQNKCLRIIFHIKYDPENHVSTQFLHSKSKLELLEERSESLSSNYLFQAQVYNNPIIVELLDEYEQFKDEFNIS